MTSPAFASLAAPMGFYPVVPDAAWVIRLLGWGARTIQLRFKADPDDPAHAQQIALQVQTSVAAARVVPGARLFINDHWVQAVQAGAYGVHLGQEDWAALEPAERATLRACGVRLGLSTHTPSELALALAAAPSYVAVGPVFATTLKAMPYEPVGLERLAHWSAQAGGCPVVAIGGISLERVPGVMDCGVQGVAMVSAVTQAADPQRAAGQLLEACRPRP